MSWPRLQSGGGGDVEVFIGFHKHGAVDGLAQAEEQGDFPGMRLGELAHAVQGVGPE